MNCRLTDHAFAVLVDLCLKKHKCLLLTWRRFHDQLINTDIDTSLFRMRYIVTSTGLQIGYDYQNNVALLFVGSQWNRNQLFKVELLNIIYPGPLKYILSHFHCADENQQVFVYHVNNYKIVLNLSPTQHATVSVESCPDGFCQNSLFCHDLGEGCKLLNYYKMNDGLRCVYVKNNVVKIENLSTKEIKDIQQFNPNQTTAMFGPFICSQQDLQMLLYDVRNGEFKRWVTLKNVLGYLYDEHFDRMLIFMDDGCIHEFGHEEPINNFNLGDDKSFVVCKHCPDHILDFYPTCSEPLTLNSAFNLLNQN